jgi:hypothetical protein
MALDQSALSELLEHCAPAVTWISFVKAWRWCSRPWHGGSSYTTPRDVTTPGPLHAIDARGVHVHRAVRHVPIQSRRRQVRRVGQWAA